MVEPQLRLIQFVTRHYAELRGGVKRAALAPVLLAVLLVGDGGVAEAMTVAPGYVGLAALLDRWMNHRFGRVISSVALNRVVSLMCVVAFFVTRPLDWLGTGRASLVFFSAAAYALWLCVRQWPFGIHNLLPGIVAAGFAMLFGSLTRERFFIWERHAYVSTLLAWTVAGMFDCTLLMRVLPRRSSVALTADAPEEHADAV